MTASITTTSTTLEAQLLEVAGNVQVTEAAQSTADVELNNCQIDFDLEAGTVSISAILPISTAMVSGKLEMVAQEYLA